MRILTQTRCRVGQHVWIWSSWHTVTEPNDAARCDCGLYTWKDRPLPEAEGKGEDIG
jgi:hypothetical protein